ncbi:MAG: DUF72 domain-containing protein [Gemmatimonadota bacterium]
MSETAVTPSKVEKPGSPIRIGCAGWAIRTDCSEHFPEAGSHLARYAERFNAVEINSTFHRSHRPATFARWAESVPADFLFSLKGPKAIIHERRFVDVADIWRRFVADISPLGPKLSVILIQTPGSLEFDREVGGAFFETLRATYDGAVVLEARNAGWAQDDAEKLLSGLGIGRVAADPPKGAGDGSPRGRIAYHRLHGSPHVYHSAYGEQFLEQLGAKAMAEAAEGLPVWCVFDNTARGAATGNAIRLTEIIRQS